MRHRLKLILIAPVLALLGLLGLMTRAATPAPLDMAAYAALYANPAPAPDAARQVYHLGHSLVAQDMPAMLAQLAPAGHSYASQLGWGASMRSHWEPDVPINGFDVSNDHAAYRDAHEGIGSGDYDVLVLTEMVEIKDAIKYHDSPQYLHHWAAKGRDAGAAVYFYETWHPLDSADGWLTRLDRDLALYWEGQIMRPALAQADPPQPIYLIPGGQVMAAFSRALEAQGGVGPLQSHADLFKDNIHFNDYGAYLMALTHYAVLYQRDPAGLPHTLLRANGTPADDVGAAVAALMQSVVWDVVTSLPQTGVPHG